MPDWALEFRLSKGSKMSLFFMLEIWHNVFSATMLK